MTTIATPTTTTFPGRPLRSAAAVFLGFLSVAVLSLATDHVLHVLEVYPPWGQPMWETSLNLLALSYRILYTVLGGYIAATLAPRSRMRHVAVLGIIGFITASAGAVAAMNLNLGPNWYPIALAVTGFPCVWLGGLLFTRRTPAFTS